MPVRIRLVFALATVASTFSILSESAIAQPNVIVIVSDDAGYADFGFTEGIVGAGFTDSNGNAVSLTPNLDALAARGVTLSRAYVAANCQPTRAALVTGAYQQRIGNENVGNNHYLATQIFEGVPNDTTTIWDNFKNQGYTTGAVGKWHLGEIENSGGLFGNRPQNQGVDQFFGMWHGDRDYTLRSTINVNGPQQIDALREVLVTARDANGNATAVTDTIEEGNGVAPSYKNNAAYSDDYVTTLFGKYSADFISEHAGNNQPFMLYQAFTAPHKPWTDESPFYNHPTLTGSGAGQLDLNDPAEHYRRQVASMMKVMDDEIGRTLDRLRDPNGDGDFSDSIEDNTLIVFINDNGGVSGKQQGVANAINGTNNGVFSQFKGSPLDGGIRVPMIIAGAGVTAPGGTVYDKTVHGIDVLPTVFGATGNALGADQKIDGVNLLPFINGDNTDNPHDAIVAKWRGTFAVIEAEGTYKLVNTANIAAQNANPEFQYRLYNTVDDPGESTNLVNDPGQADRVARLKRELTRHEAFFDKGRYAILARSVDDDLNGDGPGGPTEEPRNIFDHFVFNPTGGTQNWSATDGWLAKDGIDNIPNSDASSPGKTMYTSDSFAGAIVEFGTSDMTSYTANNNLVRQTGQTYMLNKMMLTGDFNGPANRSAVINGKDLLFTNDLNDVGPQLTIDASNTGVNGFSYAIDTNLILYDDLSITGDGEVDVTISGQISEFYNHEDGRTDPDFGARGLTKQGSSTVTLTGSNTYSGDTTIVAGTLALAGNDSLNNSGHIEVKSGAAFDVSGRSSGGVTLASGQSLGGSGMVKGNVAAADGSTVGPGSSFGQLTIDGDFTLQSGSNLTIEIGELQTDATAGIDYDQLEVTGDLVLQGGDLVVTLKQGSTLKAGDLFNILDFAGRTGDFGDVELPTLDNGLQWNTSALLTSGQLSVVSAVPEP